MDLAGRRGKEDGQGGREYFRRCLTSVATGGGEVWVGEVGEEERGSERAKENGKIFSCIFNSVP